MIEIPSQRHLFDIPEGVAYFNRASNSPLLNESRDHLHMGVNTKSHPWERTANDSFDDSESIRDPASNLFGGDVGGYAAIPSASYGMSAAARAIEPTLQSGDTMVLSDEAFPSNHLPWERTAIEKGVKIVAVPNWYWTDGAFIDLKIIGHDRRSVKATLPLMRRNRLPSCRFRSRMRNRISS